MLVKIQSNTLYVTKYKLIQLYPKNSNKSTQSLVL